MSPSHIIFDLDGTLIDSSASILAGFEHAFRQHGLTPRRALTQDLIGPPLMQTLAMLSDDQSTQTLLALASSFKQHYDSDGYKQTVVFPGVSDLLENLAASAEVLYIATNKRLNPTLKIMQHLGWNRYFQHVYALDYYQPALPSKQVMIGRILQDHAIKIDSAVYVGDRYEDGTAADAHQLAFCLARWGYLDDSLGDIPEHWLCCDSLENMQAMFKNP